MSDLKKECAKKKYRVENLNGISSYFKNFSEEFDITVDTGKTVYAFKFWDASYKNTNVIFMPNGTVYKRKKVVDVFGDDGKRTHTVLETKEGRLVLKDVVYPTGRVLNKYLLVDRSGSFYRYTENNTVKLQVKDTLYDMTVSSRENVIEMISRS